MERVLSEFVQDVQQLYGNDLVAVILYGSAAVGEHVPGRSDINLAVVLTQLKPEMLRRASGHLRAWARQGCATPLFFDPEFLRGALDVFPIELFDMQERHRILWGPDVLADLRIETESLRRQCERDVRGHLLKLRQAYLESSRSPRDLEAVLMSAASGLVVLARTLLRLARADASGGAEAVFRRVEAQFGVRVENLWKAWQIKRGAARVTGSEVDLLYQAVLDEFQQLARVANDLPA